jgi:hypothetical protein
VALFVFVVLPQIVSGWVEMGWPCFTHAPFEQIQVSSSPPTTKRKNTTIAANKMNAEIIIISGFFINIRLGYTEITHTVIIRRLFLIVY